MWITLLVGVVSMQMLISRLKEFILRFNSQCDSLSPRSREWSPAYIYARARSPEPRNSGSIYIVASLVVAYVLSCELNPIELAWASVKGYVARYNRDYNLREVERVLNTRQWICFVGMWWMLRMSILRRMGYCYLHAVLFCNTW